MSKIFPAQNTNQNNADKHTHKHRILTLCIRSPHDKCDMEHTGKFLCGTKVNQMSFPFPSDGNYQLPFK